MCEFKQLYFNEDGYVVRCIQCGHYHIGYASTMLVFTAIEFATLCKMVKYKCSEATHGVSENIKCISIPTPSRKVTLLLTQNEAIRFSDILDTADTEEKTLALISMFNS